MSLRNPNAAQRGALIAVIVVLLALVRLLEVSAGRPLTARAGAVITFLFVAGALVWTSLAAAYTRNTDRDPGWWQLLLFYLLTSLALAPLSLVRMWLTAIGDESSPLIWIAVLLVAKLLQVLFFAWVVWRSCGSIRKAQHSRTAA
jgi:hypothetical protein